MGTRDILFYSILFYSILFYSILFYSIIQTLAASDDYQVLAEWEPEIDVDTISPPGSPPEGARVRSEREGSAESSQSGGSELEKLLSQDDIGNQC